MVYILTQRLYFFSDFLSFYKKLQKYKTNNNNKSSKKPPLGQKIHNICMIKPVVEGDDKPWSLSGM